MSTISSQEWVSIFTHDLPRNRGARDFLISEGIGSFGLLRLAVADSSFGTGVNRRALDGWLEVVQAFRHVSHLDSNQNHLCHDLSESVCQKLSERASIGESDRARFLYEWAKIDSHRGKIVDSLALITEARRLNPWELQYALRHANVLESNRAFESHNELVAIYKDCLARLSDLVANEDITPRAAAYYEAQARIGLGNARDGD
jgi:hypothetical protein